MLDQSREGVYACVVAIKTDDKDRHAGLRKAKKELGVIKCDREEALDSKKIDGRYILTWQDSKRFLLRNRGKLSTASC